MADIPAPPTDAQRFIARLNSLDHLPSWTEAASLGVQLVDLSSEELALRDALIELEQASRGLDAVVNHSIGAWLSATCDLSGSLSVVVDNSSENA